MPSRILVAISALLALTLPSPVYAAWYKAESDRFVIYADDSEKDIRRFAQSLERFHSAMELLTGRKLEAPSPSNRLTIFVVGDHRDIKRLVGNKKSSIAGFYSARAGGSRAFVQDVKMTTGQPSFSMVILMHEYAHHFLISSSRHSMPRWLSEGGAEFFASASFPSDGGVSIGRPALHRAGELRYADDLTIEEILDHEIYAKRKSRRYNAFYGQSWLLYHMLSFKEERRGQIAKYWSYIVSGKAPLDAARQAFGDLDELEREMRSYMRQRRMFSYSLKPDMVGAGLVKITRLSEGEAKVMPLLIRSQRGVNDEQAAELVIEVREVAEEYPNDPGVLTALAEAEYDSGDDDAAIAAANRAIALDPGRINAYVQKGYALFRKAEDSDDQRAAYRQAMVPFSALNKIENDHPLPLIYYYRSYVARGVTPPENAKHALERAAELAPFDQDIWFQVALMQAQEGKIELARFSLAPIANNPHESSLTKHASYIYDAMGHAPEGEPFTPPPMIDIPDVPEVPDPDSD